MSLVIVVAGWLIVSLLGVTRASQSAQLDDRLKQLDDQLKTPALQQTTTQYNTLETVLSNIKTLRDERLLFDPTWQTIKKSVPKDVQFTSFTLGDDSTFRISGVGRSVSSVAQFAAALAQQPQFKTVTPLSVDKQTNKDVYNFSISFKLVGAKQ
jgi:Tfp pilus assembly protein PilN